MNIRAILHAHTVGFSTKANGRDVARFHMFARQIPLVSSVVLVVR